MIRQREREAEERERKGALSGREEFREFRRTSDSIAIEPADLAED